MSGVFVTKTLGVQQVVEIVEDLLNRDDIQFPPSSNLNAGNNTGWVDIQQSIDQIDVNTTDIADIITDLAPWRSFDGSWVNDSSVAISNVYSQFGYDQPYKVVLNTGSGSLDLHNDLGIPVNHDYSDPNVYYIQTLDFNNRLH